MTDATTPTFRPLLVFFALTFALAWAVWLTLGVFFEEPPTGLVVLGAWSPTVAALLVTARTEGRRGVRRLLHRVLKWRVSFLWYAVAIGGAGLLALATIALTGLLGGTVPTLSEVASRFGLTPEQGPLLFVMLPFIFLVTVFGGPIAEELGWRGYAQTKLQARLGPIKAGLLLGLVWALWHLPLFSVLPSATGNVPPTHFLPLVVALGGLFGWLYARTNGSVLLSVLAHAGVNFVLSALGLVTTHPQLLATFVALAWLALFCLGGMEARRRYTDRSTKAPGRAVG